MSIARHSGLNDQISQEAAEWLVDIRSGDLDAAGRREFDAWLRASPEHIRAFIDMTAIWQDGGTIDPRRQLNVEEIVARARSEQNIAELTPAQGDGAPASMLPAGSAASGGSVHATGAGGGIRQPHFGRWAVAALLLAAVAATALMLEFRHPGSRMYATDAGARRSILLPDGSKVLLDSKSRLRVSYTGATRQAELLQGQALFSVTKDPRRPFVVRAGRAVVRDIGTVFDVNRLGDRTVITVVEGLVTAAGSEAARPIHLSAGEQLDVRLGQFSPHPMHVDPLSETAWTHGQVVLDSATLEEVAQVFNRYSTRRLIVKDLGNAPLRLSGVFSTNPEFLIAYLRGRADIRMKETRSAIDIVRKPAP